MDDSKPVLDQINIVVPDVAAAVDFYTLLGVDIPDSLPVWERHHREIASTGDAMHADLDSQTFAAVWNQGWPDGVAGVVVGFRVATREAVDELHDRVVTAGHRSQQVPYDAFWGARYAVVEDPAGTAVGIMSPADDDRRTAPLTPPD